MSLCKILLFADRFEQSIIEERRRSAQDLLNFVGQRHYLVASDAFQQFFKVFFFYCSCQIMIPQVIGGSIQPALQNHYEFLFIQHV